MQVIEQWSKDNERYYTIQINDKEYCNVKRTVYGYYYPIECKNGRDIYTDSIEKGIRMMTREENDIILSLCRKYDNIMLKKNIGMLSQHHLIKEESFYETNKTSNRSG